jgi:hypothetical protein
MKKLFLTAAAISALAAVAPATAQYQGQYQDQYQGQYQGQYPSRQYPNQAAPNQVNANVDANVGISNRIAELDARFQAGVRQGLIDRNEARNLRQEIRDLQRLQRQYSYNGLTQRERADLQQRIRSVRQDLRLADGRSGRDYDRWASYDNQGSYGQGGPLEQADDYYCERRSGIGGVLDSVVGAQNCLRVGERVTSNLGYVPSQYRNVYRDGGGVYYRSDGNAIYQIDARTNTVLRAYSINR